MRDVFATIEQAKALGSESRFMLSEFDAIINRTVKGYGKIDICKLIIDAYNFGFTLGYRVGRGERKKASAEAPTN